MHLGDSSFLASQCLRITCKMGPRQRHKSYAKAGISFSLLNNNEEGLPAVQLRMTWRSCGGLQAC